MPKLWLETFMFTQRRPYDNVRMEAFHSILKREEVYLKACQTLTEVQAAIGWYINFYNRKRTSNVA
ncbi:hypothetical protein EFM07_10825 [Lactococcus lactis]|uniref:IS3 family transposase n=1 Tax=Lactococcus lactis TaxID=1358 RepID=UPI0037BEE52E|nr:hypothetical protein [Lactococcus lactis]